MARRKARSAVNMAVILLFVLAVSSACVAEVSPTPSAAVPAVPNVPSPTQALPGTQLPASAASPVSNDACLTCHGNPGLVKTVATEAIRLFVDKGLYERSLHGKQTCVACHVGFTTSLPHGGATATYGSWALLAPPTPT